MQVNAFSEKWDEAFPAISQSWRRDWERVIPFFDYPKDIRKAIYTTNAIESMNMTLRKVIKNKRAFPSDDSVFKLLYLAMNNISKKWTMPIHNWKDAMNRFTIEFDQSKDRERGLWLLHKTFYRLANVLETIFKFISDFKKQNPPLATRSAPF